jgi:amino acid transporter
VAIGVTLNLCVCCAFWRCADTDLLNWFGTLATFGFILVYFLCSLAAPILLRKSGEASPMVYVMGALGCVLMVGALAGSLYPVPAAPLRYLPYGFAAYMLLGVAWFWVLKARLPHVLASTEHDLEGVLTGAK